MHTRPKPLGSCHLASIWAHPVYEPGFYQNNMLVWNTYFIYTIILYQILIAPCTVVIQFLVPFSLLYIAALCGQSLLQDNQSLLLPTPLPNPLGIHTHLLTATSLPFFTMHSVVFNLEAYIRLSLGHHCCSRNFNWSREHFIGSHLKLHFSCQTQPDCLRPSVLIQDLGSVQDPAWIAPDPQPLFKPGSNTCKYMYRRCILLTWIQCKLQYILLI